VFLCRKPESGQRHGLVVRKHPAAALSRCEIHSLVVPIRPSHGLERLGPDADVEQARPGLVEDVGVGLDLSAHDDLALPERGLDHDVTGVPVEGSAVNITPERSEGIITWTTTLRAGSVSRHGSPVRDDPGTVERGPAVHHTPPAARRPREHW